MYKDQQSLYNYLEKNDSISNLISILKVEHNKNNITIKFFLKKLLNNITTKFFF